MGTLANALVAIAIIGGWVLCVVKFGLAWRHRDVVDMVGYGFVSLAAAVAAAGRDGHA